MLVLSCIFFFVSTFYSMVGFGGGSSYIAFLVLFDVPYTQIPIIALLCNIAVSGIASFRYISAGHLNWKLFLSFSISSVPFAFWGGMIPIEKKLFLLLLAICLFSVGIKLILTSRSSSLLQDGLRKNGDSHSVPSIWIGIIVGASLGFISGMVGIGGGIFLSPILLNFKWGTPKQVSTTAALFIFINSISGLIGQFQKGLELSQFTEFSSLFLIVLLGGFLGSSLGAKKIRPQGIQQLTAGLVILVSIRLFIL